MLNPPQKKKSIGGNMGKCDLGRRFFLSKTGWVLKDKVSERNGISESRSFQLSTCGGWNQF